MSEFIAKLEEQISKLDKETIETLKNDSLLDIETYPQNMFMDVYGNGHTTWDQPSDTFPEVLFRIPYIRADIHETLKAERDALRKELKNIAVYDCCYDGGGSCDTLDLINKIAREALKKGEQDGN